MKKLLAAASLAALSLSAHAEIPAQYLEAPSYSYFDFGYTQWDDANELKGQHLKFGYEFDFNIFVSAENHKLESDIDEGYTLGFRLFALGYKHDLDEKSSVFGSFARVNVKDSTAKANMVTVGYRAMPVERVEFGIEANHTDFEEIESKAGFAISGQYYLEKQLSFKAEVRDWIDETSFILGFRYSF
ncbi:hypothetical protein [Pleionea sp. CnH1-48]|uniref:hypothetical protein n=1 Tax=Pleionea sp. CnH1-48 TaxID=2954494 RepID=UPI002097081F|nr:hypothetical protein [Pleionea sp. CnH1-48]MCO7223865.1 hypothetical protein [Pleionea sp. CnH1-48]